MNGVSYPGRVIFNVEGVLITPKLVLVPERANIDVVNVWFQSLIPGFAKDRSRAFAAAVLESVATANAWIWLPVYPAAKTPVNQDWFINTDGNPFIPLVAYVVAAADATVVWFPFPDLSLH